MLLAACGAKKPGQDGKTTDAAPEADVATETRTANADPDALVEISGSAGLSEWRHQRAEQCLSLNEQPSTPSEEDMARLRGMITATPLGQRIIRDLERTPVTLCPDTVQDIGHDAAIASYLDLQKASLVRTTFVNSTERLPDNLRSTATAHELRHAWQDQSNLLALSKGDLAPTDHAALIFMLEADGRAFELGTAWQMKQAGDDRPWEVLRIIYQNSAPLQRFEQTMTELEARGGRALTTSDDGIRSAMHAAYKGWFEDPNNYGVYQRHIAQQMTVLAAEWTGTGSLPDNTAAQLGRLPGQASNDRKSYLSFKDQAAALDLARQSLPDTAPPAAPSGRVLAQPSV